MNATDELRRMLDERGVEHFDTVGITEWDGANGRTCRSYARPESMTVDVAMIAVPPKQAIEATLGRTCRIRGGECDQCGAIIHEHANLYWVPVGEGMRTVEHRDVHYCPNCGAKVVDE